MLNETLRLIRNVNGLKGRELAELLAISPSFLSEIESGKKEPSLDLIRKYSEVLHTRPSKIMYLAEKLEEAKTDKTIREKLSALALSVLYKFNVPEDLVENG